MPDSLSPQLVALVIAAGFTAGVINTLAGNGSAITLPLLILLGLPPTVANGTNRIGVIFQSLASTATYHRRGVMPWRAALILIAPTSLGAVFGAGIAVNLNEAQMRLAIGGMMLLTFVLILLRPERWLQGRAEGVRNIRWFDVLIFFGIGVYGGFIQAGVGIFLLAALVLGLGFNLMHGNALKAFLSLALNIVALFVFVRNDQVNWTLGFILAVGQILGGWVAARMAIQPRAQVWVYRLLLVVVLVSAAQLFLRR